MTTRPILPLSKSDYSCKLVYLLQELQDEVEILYWFDKLYESFLHESWFSA